MVPADRQGRIPRSWTGAGRELAAATGPTRLLVCLQAGNIHSGAYDPFVAASPSRKAHGAWVHVDGAFGLWAAAVPELAALTAGLRTGRLLGHRRAQDPQRALRLRHRRGRGTRALRAAMGMQASYLIQDADGAATRSKRSRSCPAGPAACRCGRR